jgi:hypothetical protein
MNLAGRRSPLRSEVGKRAKRAGDEGRAQAGERRRQDNSKETEQTNQHDIQPRNLRRARTDAKTWHAFPPRGKQKKRWCISWAVHFSSS